MLLRSAAIALTAAIIASGPVLACKGVDKLLEEDFSAVDRAWRQLAPMMTIKDGALQLTTEPQYHSSVSYEGDFFNAGDACLTVIAPDLKDDNIGIGGIMFYLTKDYDFYVFVVAPGMGTAAVMRITGGEYLFPVDFAPFEFINTGPNSKNTLRVTWDKGEVSTYINDQPFATLKAKPPSNGKIGLYAESFGGSWTFDDILVTSVPQ